MVKETPPDFLANNVYDFREKHGGIIAVSKIFLSDNPMTSTKKRTHL